MTLSRANRQDLSRAASWDHGFGCLARALLRHRKAAGLFWLAVAVAGIALVGPIAGRLSASTAFPGLPSDEAGLAIDHAYGNGGNNSPTVTVVTLPAGERVESPAGSAKVSAIFAALDADRWPRAVFYPSVKDPRLVSWDGRAALGLIFGAADAPFSAALAAQLRARAPTGVTVTTTSLTDLYNAPGNDGLGVLGEAVIGAIGALSSSSSVRSSPSSPCS